MADADAWILFYRHDADDTAADNLLPFGGHCCVHGTNAAIIRCAPRVYAFTIIIDVRNLQ